MKMIAVVDTGSQGNAKVLAPEVLSAEEAVDMIDSAQALIKDLEQIAKSKKRKVKEA